MDKNNVKMPSNLCMDRTNYMPIKKVSETHKKIKSALMTPQNVNTIKMKSPKKVLK